MERDSTTLRDLLILVSGIALVLLAHTAGVASSASASQTLEALGLAMAGYAPIRLAIHSATRLRERRTGRSIDRLFRSAVRIVERRDELPFFIAADIEGCITPSNRGDVDLRKFQRLRGYFEFVKKNPEYPQIVIYSGRSQGYVELLAQSLGMLHAPLDLPFVIENGSALYYPTSRRTVPLITQEQMEKIHQARSLLARALPENEFEPKSYMVTLNPKNPQQSIDDLRDEINDLLRGNHMLDQLFVTSTASAVDVTVRGIDKYFGLKQVLESFPRDNRDRDLRRVVAIADHLSDRKIVQSVGSAYCPAENVHPEIRDIVVERFGADHVINEPFTDFVSAVIERECRLQLL